MFQGEMRAFEAQAATLNDLFPVTGSPRATYSGQSNGVPLTIMQPVDDAMKEVNREAFRDFMKANSDYNLSEQSQGGPEYVKP